MTVEPQSQKSESRIPLWVAWAGMLLALVLAVIIMLTILQPLTNLIFPADPEIPLPNNIELVEEVENPPTSTGEWLYRSQMDACRVVQFYLENGGSCNISTASCELNEDSDLVIQQNNLQLSSVGTCRGGSDAIANSYTWEVLISSQGGEYPTIFRIYLYTER